MMNQARIVLASFPEVTQVVSQVGRPDDGTDTTGFFNTEYFVDLKPKEQWRPVFHQNKEELIAAMDRELEKIPGALWNFSQPIADNMEEAVSGVKGQLAIKIYGDDLKTLEAKGDEIVSVMRTVPGVADLGLFRVIGQPNLEFTVDRDAGGALRHQCGRRAGRHRDRGGRQSGEPGAAGRAALRPGGALSGAAIATPKKPSRISGLLAPSGERVSLAQLCDVKVLDGASEIYREGNSRYVAIKYSVPVRDLGSTVEEAIRKVDAAGEAARRLSHRLGGRVREPEALAASGCMIVVPITMLVICMILYTMFSSFKWVLADSGQRGHGADRRPAGAADSRARISACRRASDSWRCSACRCRPA